jgi:hypothetical protein
MNELIIDCKGINNISWHSSNGIGQVTLSNVTMDFLENVPAKDIVLYCNNEAILKEMDSGEIIDYLRENFDVDIKERR